VLSFAGFVDLAVIVDFSNNSTGYCRKSKKWYLCIKIESMMKREDMTLKRETV
jgi:hypothetical protein